MINAAQALASLGTALLGLVPAALLRAAEPEFHRRWAGQALAQQPAPPLPSDRLVLVREGSPGDTKVGRCAAGGPLRLGNKVYQRGIGVNSHCVLRVELSRPAARLVADVGLDRNVDGTPASSAFHVAVGGKDVFATKVLRPADGVQKIDVPLAGARQLELIVDEGGDGRGFDQGDWADARVVLEDGSDLWLDDLAARADVGTGLYIVRVQEALRRLSPPSPSIGKQAGGTDGEEDEGRRFGNNDAPAHVVEPDIRHAVIARIIGNCDGYDSVGRSKAKISSEFERNRTREDLPGSGLYRHDPSVRPRLCYHVKPDCICSAPGPKGKRPGGGDSVRRPKNIWGTRRIQYMQVYGSPFCGRIGG